MKKLVAIGLSMVMVLGMSSMAFANNGKKVEMKTKEVGVTLTAPTEEVQVGEVVNLSAVTAKHGQLVSDDWDIAIPDGDTTLNEVGEYVSNATFSATEAGTYEIIYSIRMEAGKSGVAFVGKGTAEVTYVDNYAVVVQKVTIKVVSRQVLNSQNVKLGLEVTIELSDEDMAPITIQVPSFVINHQGLSADYTVEYENKDLDIEFEEDITIYKTAQVGNTYTWELQE